MLAKLWCLLASSIRRCWHNRLNIEHNPELLHIMYENNKLVFKRRDMSQHNLVTAKTPSVGSLCKCMDLEKSHFTSQGFHAVFKYDLLA